MNREILFRGKRIDNNEWVYGYLVKDEDGTTYIAGNSDFYCEVIPETIGEYTGLTDKNGKKIFEGDIVNLFDTIGDVMEKVTIKWNSETACYEVLQLNGNHYSFDTRCVLKDCEVIGNIYDKEVE